MALNDPEMGGRPGGVEGDPQLSRVYREAAREEPPSRLDSRVLAAARREIGARTPSLAARVHAWRVPVSIAAVVVLSVSLVTLTMEKGGERPTQAPTSASPAPPPEAASSLEPAAPEPDPARPPDARSLAAPAPMLRNDAGRRETSDRLQFETTAPGVPGVESATRPPPAAKEAPRLRQSAPLVRQERDAQATGEAATPPAPALRISALVREYENQPPDKWLERIVELRRQGQTTVAEELLAEFSRRFPNHPLPLPSR